MKARVEPVLKTITDETNNPYQISEDQLIENNCSPSKKPKIFDFSGRISLSRYWLLHVPFVLGIPTALLIFFIIGLRHQPAILLMSSMAVIIPSGLLSISLLMRRARDLGWPPAWGLISMLIPGIGFLIMLPLVTLPGHKKANKYGSPNPPLSMLGRVFAYLLITLAFIGSIALFTYSSEFSPLVISDWITQSWGEALR